jgi:hypothetical protein
MKKLAAICLVTACAGAAAQNVLNMKMAAQPLIYTEVGRTTGCGVRIVGAVTPLAGQREFRTFDISANVYEKRIALGKVIGEVHAVTYADPAPAGRRQVLYGAWFRSEGDDPMAPVGNSFASSSGDKGAYLFQTTVGAAADFVLATIKGKPIQVGLRWEKNKETIYAGTVELSDDERRQVASCFGQILK